MYMWNAKQTVTNNVAVIQATVIIGLCDVAICRALAIVPCTKNVRIDTPIMFCVTLKVRQQWAVKENIVLYSLMSLNQVTNMYKARSLNFRGT